jgi:hypothetical protein
VVKDFPVWETSTCVSLDKHYRSGEGGMECFCLKLLNNLIPHLIMLKDLRIWEGLVNRSEVHNKIKQEVMKRSNSPTLLTVINNNVPYAQFNYSKLRALICMVTLSSIASVVKKSPYETHCCTSMDSTVTREWCVSLGNQTPMLIGASFASTYKCDRLPSWNG